MGELEPQEHKATFSGAQLFETESTETTETVETAIGRPEKDAVVREIMEVVAVDRVIDGLEVAVLQGGLQTLADRYSAAAVVKAFETGHTMTDIYKILEPNASQRHKLLDEIATDDHSDLYARFNAAGGVNATNIYGDNADVARRHNAHAAQDGDIAVPSGVDTLFTSDFVIAMERYPDLTRELMGAPADEAAGTPAVEGSQDFVAYIAAVRERYNHDAEALAGTVATTRERVAQRLEAAVAAVAERYSSAEAAQVEAAAEFGRLLSTTTNEIVSTALQNGLTASNEAAATLRVQAEQEKAAATAAVQYELGLEQGLDSYGLNSAQVPRPIQPRPIILPDQAERS